MTPDIDCYRVGAVPNLNRLGSTLQRAPWNLWNPQGLRGKDADLLKEAGCVRFSSFFCTSLLVRGGLRVQGLRV